MDAREAFQRNWSGLFEVLPAYVASARCWREDDMLIGISGWPVAAFNAAILDDEYILTNMHLDKLRALFHRFGVPYSIQVCCDQANPACESLLYARGYSRWFADPLLICEGELNPLVRNPAVEIIPVSSPASLETYRHIVQEIFDLPSLLSETYIAAVLKMRESQQFIAVLNGKSVGVGMLMCCNGIAGLYEIGTLASARSQGVGTAMVEKLHHHAISQGYRGTVLASSAMGLPLYLRLGYQANGYQIGYSLEG